MQREICQTIEQLLQAHAPTHLTPHLKVTWERGFLTGLVARLAEGNASIRLQLERELWEAHNKSNDF